MTGDSDGEATDMSHSGDILPQIDLKGVTADSRRVRPGYLFAAIPGETRDGRDFIDDALARGASAVLSTPDVAADRVGPNVTLIHDANPRRRYARIAAAFHRVQPDLMVAVTGTNGKTSVAEFTRQIWAAAGFSAASIGTLGLVRSDGALEDVGGPAMTTPDAADLHRQLADLARSGVRAASMEASSHGLDQYRLDGVRFSAAAFTNLSRDHLDYHGGMEAYRAAKLRLFEEILPKGGVAVVNTAAREHDAIANIAAERQQRVLSYGLNHGAIRCVSMKPHAGGFDLELDIRGERAAVDFPLPGAFQVENALAAIGLTIACGLEPRRAVGALSSLTGVRGRLERAAVLPNGAAVYVDYAHTPEAIETALRALRVHAQSRALHIVFGCGGDRDPGKRPLMGQAAAANADRVVLTDDNPRNEEPAAIRAAAIPGCPAAIEIGDRRAAVENAMAALGPGDILCVAGKGHEQGQTVGDVVHPFDDATVARDCAKTMAESASGAETIGGGA